MQYTEKFLVKKVFVKMKVFTGIFFLYFSYFCSKHKLNGEAVLMSTHNLCFGAKIRKIGIPLHTPVLLYKSGVYGGIHVRDMYTNTLIDKPLVVYPMRLQI